MGIDVKVVGRRNIDERGRRAEKIFEGIIIAGNKIDSLTRHVNFGDRSDALPMRFGVVRSALHGG